MSAKHEASADVMAAPIYSLAGLFLTGRLDAVDESALEDLAAIRHAMQRMVVPASGWMSPRYSTDNSRPVPRGLDRAASWKRYKRFFVRNRAKAAQPSPDLPWGLSWASVVLILVTEPVTFESMARTLEMTPKQLAARFVAIVRDHARNVSVRPHHVNSGRLHPIRKRHKMSKGPRRNWKKAGK